MSRFNGFRDLNTRFQNRLSIVIIDVSQSLVSRLHVKSFASRTESAGRPSLCSRILSSSTGNRYILDALYCHDSLILSYIIKWCNIASTQISSDPAI
ncbi:hypothetical protein TNCV_1446001 [Trichonephila clavipes]|nr:hypothetical protein TNCV_1446001 [Trichonephila clavipes]